MASPTEQAQYQFRKAHTNFMDVVATLNDQAELIPMELREGLKGLALGMDQLAVGMRATYQLLEKMQTDIEDLKRTQRPGRP